MIPINYLAVLVSVVVLIILGSLWYGPLFGKAYLKEVGITPEDMERFKNDPEAKKKMNKSYALMALSSLVMVFVLAHALVFASSYMHLSGILAGLEAGFWNWIGFIVPATLGGVLWENKSWKWFGIVAGYYLVALIVAGCILALWV